MSITSVVNDTLGRDSFVNSQKPLPPTITGYSISGLDDTALDPAGGQTVFINGNGFQRGATVTFDGSAVSVVTWVSANRLSFVAPAKSAGTYTIYVVNADGGTAIFIPGVIYSTLPTWTTAAGSLGSFFETTSISRTLVASGDAPITYSLLSGSLPPGATLSSNGVISGTSPVESGSTTYSFTVETIDAQLQGSTRSFSLTINTDVVTWTNPSPGATINLDGSAYTTTLSALSAAGYSISGYSSNTLPQGLTLTGNTISGTPTTEATVSTVLSATAATTNRVGTNSITWVVSLGDAQFPNVTTLLSPQLSVRPFTTDASINNFPVTVFGDTRANNFGPYTPGYYSNFFDGSTSYLTAPVTAASGDLTIECWIFPTAATSPRGFIVSSGGNDTTGWGLSYNTDNRIGLWLAGYGGAAVNSTSTIPLNTWGHIAIVKTSGTVFLYVNGERVSPSVPQASTFGSANNAVIGTYNAGINTQSFAGYISNFRYVNGTALYTGTTFTPPTQPLTAVSGTTLLTCQSNRFIDASASNVTITPFGATRIDGFDPFVIPQELLGRGSAFFDGTGDYITVPANAALQLTGDFTIEAWIYPTAINSFNMVFGSENGTNSDYLTIRASTLDLAIANASYPAWSHTFVANRWYHIAVTRSANTLRAFVNGVALTLSSGSATNSAQMFQSAGGVSVGRYGLVSTPHHFTGYIADARIIKGTALYTAAFTPPTQPLTAVTNTSLLTCQTNQPHNNSQFLDSSTNNMLVTRTGNSTQGSFSPYGGGWSNYFDGNGDFLDLPNNTVFSQTGSWTLELWVCPTAAVNNYVYSQNTANFLQINITGTNFVNIDRSGVGNIITSTSAIPLNAWTHIALVSDSTNMRLFINGTQSGSTAPVGTQAASATTTRIGAYQGTGTLAYQGYISNLRLVKGTAVYTANFTPPIAPLQPVAGTSLLTCCDNRLIDDSPSNFAITRNGDVRVEKFNPFGARTSMVPQTHSVFFDGTGDFLTLPSTSGIFNFGTQDFTIEAWVYPTTTSSYRQIAGSTYSTTGGALYLLDNTALFYANGAYAQTPVNSIVPNTWQHVAAVRTSGTLRIYINGVERSSTALTLNLINTDGVIGARTANTSMELYTGYISNLRVVKNAVYTAAFTPPTAPLTTVTNTSLLTCQSSTLVDNSPNRFAITASGDVRPTQTNPFGFTPGTRTGYTPQLYGGSMSFDGSGDFLTATNVISPGTGDFTWEYWVYTTRNNVTELLVSTPWSAPGWQMFVSNGKLQWQIFSSASAASVANIVPYTWTHIAWTRQSGTMRIFINGVLDNTVVNQNNNVGTRNTFYAGARDGVEPLLGYLSDIRITTGQALYTSSFVPPIAPVQPTANTVLMLSGRNAAVYDSSTQSNLETIGDAKLEQFNPYSAGYYSNFFDGNGDFLTAASNAAFGFGTGDFTVECWLYPTNAGAALNQFYDNRTSTEARANIGIRTNTITYAVGSTIVLTSAASSIVNNIWQHVALVRSSGTTRIYINGVQSGPSYTDSNDLGASAECVIGTVSDSRGSSQFTFNGHISNLRVVKGTAVYTAAFTPPTQPLTAITNTTLLTCQSNRFIDNSTNNFAITRNGDVRIDRLTPFALPQEFLSSGSAFFDGTGDVLTMPNNPTLAFGTGDFTVEMWYYTTAAPTSTNVCLYNTGSGNFFLQLRNTAFGIGVVGSAENNAFSSNFVANQWYHLAVSRSGTTVRGFVNGVLISSGTNSVNYGQAGATIGGLTSASQLVTGYISDLRVTRGVGRYTANFAPPTRALATR